MNMTILKILVQLQNVAKREEGQDLVEYALITGLLAVAAVALINGIGTSVVNLFTSVNSTLAGA